MSSALFFAPARAPRGRDFLSLLLRPLVRFDPSALRVLPVAVALRLRLRSALRLRPVRARAAQAPAHILPLFLFPTFERTRSRTRRT